MTPEQRAADWFTLPPVARTKAWLAREFRKAIEERPYFVAAECYEGCTDPWCPYNHFSGWKIPGVEGLHETEEKAVKCT